MIDISRDKFFVLMVVLLLSLILAISGCTNQREVAKPQLDCRNLEVSPREVKIGEKVLISVEVKNMNDKSVSSDIELYINGKKEKSKPLELDSRETKEVTFTITKNRGKSYDVKIGDLRESFEVIEYSKSQYETMFENFTERRKPIKDEISNKLKLIGNATTDTQDEDLVRELHSKSNEYKNILNDFSSKLNAREPPDDYQSVHENLKKAIVFGRSYADALINITSDGTISKKEGDELYYVIVHLELEHMYLQKASNKIR